MAFCGHILLQEQTFYPWVCLLLVLQLTSSLDEILLAKVIPTP